MYHWEITVNPFGWFSIKFSQLNFSWKLGLKTKKKTPHTELKKKSCVKTVSTRLKVFVFKTKLRWDCIVKGYVEKYTGMVRI